MSFSYTVETKKSLDSATRAISKNLRDMGFGILGSLDFKKILKEKGLRFDDNYRLLEVCNPKLAMQVLQANPDFGLLLPCTIAIYQKNKSSFISLAKPSSILGLMSENNVQFLAKEIEEKLTSVVEKSK